MMVKIIKNKIILFLVLPLLASCSQGVVTSSGQNQIKAESCQSAGFFNSQTECETANDSATCVMFSNLINGQSSMCWKLKKISPIVPNGSLATPSFSPVASATPCTWIIGAWNPASCGLGTTARTRTVQCPNGCNCPAPSPNTSETCTPDLFMGKHYASDCMEAGGNVLIVNGIRACVFNGQNCHQGWTTVQVNRTIFTEAKSVDYKEYDTCKQYTIKKTKSHSFSAHDIDADRISYCYKRKWNCKCEYELAGPLTTKIFCY